METIGEIRSKSLEKIKRCDEIKKENDSKMHRRLSWDNALDSKACAEFVGGDKEIKFEPISGIEEVFRDPSTFDFLSTIGSSNPLRDLRKESLYLKFDPCLRPQSPKEEISSFKDSSLQKRKVFHKADLTTSLCNNDTKLVDIPDELPLPDLCRIEPLLSNTSEKNPDEFTFSKASETVSSNNETLIDIEVEDSSVEKLASMKQELLDLRALVVKRELEHREAKKDLEMTLQNRIQKKIQDTSQQEEVNKNLRAIMREYEEFITSLIIEKNKSASEFEETKKALEKEIERLNEHKAITSKSYADLTLKDDNMEKAIIFLKEEISRAEVEIKNTHYLEKKMKKEMAVTGWDLTQMVESAYKEVEISKQKQKKEIDLLETRIKTSKLKESSLNHRLQQLITQIDSVAAMLDETLKEHKL